MEFIFIRHGHGEHLDDYPNRLNTMHPSLTAYGRFQVTQLRNEISIGPDDLVLVSPTKRTIETAAIIKDGMDFIITPFVGPRMFPQNPDLPFLACDQILSRTELTDLYGDTEIVDFHLDCWKEGINRIAQPLFEEYAARLLAWIGHSCERVVMISHDGTITNYRIWLGEKGLTRQDFLGEAGIYRMNL